MKTKIKVIVLCLLSGLFLNQAAQGQIPIIKDPIIKPPTLKDPIIKLPNRPPNWSNVVIDQGFKTVWAQLPQIGRSIPVQVKEYGDNYLLEGDIILRPQQITSETTRPTQEDEYRTREQGLYGQSNVTIDGEYLWLWQYGTIPYTINGNVSDVLRRRIQNAITKLEVESEGYLRLRPRGTQRDYVEFKFKSDMGDAAGRSCLGRVGGKQEIELSSSINVGGIMHEILHAAGVYHEQTRPDRDDYVNIEWSNIKFGYYGNFMSFPTWIVGKIYSPYDYNSIMHYSQHAFGVTENGVRQRTIIPTRSYTGTIGQRSRLSDLDIKGLKRMYGRQKWYVSEDANSQWVAINNSQIEAQNMMQGDFDGDGITDLFRAANGKWYVSYNGVSGWTQINSSDITKENLILGDYNGDGITDVLYPNGSTWRVSWSGTSSWRRINRSKIKKSKLLTGDFNGDGRTDLLYPNGTIWRVSYGASSGWLTINRSNITKGSLLCGDFNGDGRSDVLYPNGSIWRISYGGNTGWQTVNTSNIEKENLLIGDIDGDGRDDVFYPNGRIWRVSYSAQGGWQTVNRSSIRKPNLKIGNFDGDNRADVFGSWDD